LRKIEIPKTSTPVKQEKETLTCFDNLEVIVNYPISNNNRLDPKDFCNIIDWKGHRYNFQEKYLSGWKHGFI